MLLNKKTKLDSTNVLLVFLFPNSRTNRMCWAGVEQTLKKVLLNAVISSDVDFACVIFTVCEQGGNRHINDNTR